MNPPAQMLRRRWNLTTISLGTLLVCLLLVVPSDGGELPKAEQARVNEAIDKGVKFLRLTQLPSGTWPGDEKHIVGYAALPGLTLLESGVPATDPAIKKVAFVIRHTYQRLDGTYEIALSILFLDRLGDPSDKKIIQTLALRLVAGQSATGGWHYKCPLLAQSDEKSLLTTLRLVPALPPLLPLLDVSPGPGVVTEPVTINVSLPFLGSVTYPAPPEPVSPGAGTEAPGRSSVEAVPDVVTGTAALQIESARSTRQNYCIKALEAAPVAAEVEPAKNDKIKAPTPAFVIPPRLRGLPIFIDAARLIMVDNPEHKTDNSNTQFAILALWVAQRYEVPMDRTLRLLVRRFQVSQHPTAGSWDYGFFLGGSEKASPQMTAVGLIGLAVGHGLAAPAPGAGVQRRVNDLAILSGFVNLNKSVLPHTGRMENLPRNVNFYFLWSLERVAVLYNLDRIGDKDWYRWGAEILVANQTALGHWEKGGYPGASPVIDTCLALLFLQRANLVKDLADKLPFNPLALNTAVAEQAKKDSAKPQTIRDLAEDTSKPDPTTTQPPVVTTDPNKGTDETKREPAKTEKKAEALPATVEPEKKKVWPYVAVGLGILLLLGAVVFVATQRRDDEEDDTPRKKKAAKKSVKR